MIFQQFNEQQHDLTFDKDVFIYVTGQTDRKLVLFMDWLPYAQKLEKHTLLKLFTDYHQTRTTNARIVRKAANTPP
ncbi:hypothetical protein GCM10026983_11920 [Gracilibacillus alcaliphilus]